MACFVFHATAPTEIYTLALHDALPIFLFMLEGGHHEKVLPLFDEVQVPYEILSNEELRERYPFYEHGTHGEPCRPEDDRFWAEPEGELIGALYTPDSGYVSDPQKRWEELYIGTAMTGRRGAGVNAIGAIDMALWDIKGKRLGVPIWDLLGGKYRQKVRAIVLLGGKYGPTRNAEEFAAAAKKAKADGYTALKMTPFLPNWANLSYGDLIRENTRIVEAVREAVGWDFDIGIEIHRNMIPGEAITFAKNIEKLDRKRVG